MSTYTVGYIIGSLSSTSINRKLAKALVKLAPEQLVLEEIPLNVRSAALQPGLRQDLPARRPASSKPEIEPSDALIFVTPEYNRSIPGSLQERDRLGVPPVRAATPSPRSRPP